MASYPALDTLLRKAHRRVLWQLVLDKGALALAIAMGGAILLLLLGRQILDWYWPVLLALAGLGAGLYQLRGKVPSLYRVAQRIDRKLQLSDSLSTALYFSRNPDPHRDAICRLQQKDAEAKAATVDLGAALPYERSRYVLPAAGLAAVALVLFGVRYATTGSLDLNQSLVTLAVDSFFGPPPTDVAKVEAKRGSAAPEPFNPGDPDQQAQNQEEQLPEDLMEPPDADTKSDADQGGKDGADQGKQDQGKQDEGGEKANNDQQQDNDEANNNGNPGEQDGKGGKPKNDSSMLDKLRDALANMLNSNKSESAKQSQQNQQKGQSQKSEQAEAQKNQNSGDSASAQNGQQQSESAQDKSDAKGGENPSKPQEASSSQGDKIGDKTVKDAKMLEAMGKITELIGKRNATLQGEMMVEVGQTKQQLKTQWTSVDAAHADGAGEIHRDEVPLMYQQYIEQYFQEIRKSEATASKNAAKAATKK